MPKTKRKSQRKSGADQNGGRHSAGLAAQRGQVLNLNDWYTVAQVIEKLGVSRQAVDAKSKKENWHTWKFGSTKLYLKTDVDATLAASGDDMARRSANAKKGNA